jgi:hypothetical protein
VGDDNKLIVNREAVGKDAEDGICDRLLHFGFKTGAQVEDGIAKSIIEQIGFELFIEVTPLAVELAVEGELVRLFSPGNRGPGELVSSQAIGASLVITCGQKAIRFSGGIRQADKLGTDTIELQLFGNGFDKIARITLRMGGHAVNNEKAETSTAGAGLDEIGSQSRKRPLHTSTH